jgi:hypothetical protein
MRGGGERAERQARKLCQLHYSNRMERRRAKGCVCVHSVVIHTVVMVTVAKYRESRTFQISRSKL